MLMVTACLLGMMWACTNTSGVSLDPAERDAMVDSIVQLKSVELKDSVDKACQMRMETDLTTAVDSIIKDILANKK